MNVQRNTLIAELIKQLRGGGAHADFTKSIDGLPAKLRGVKVNDLPYSIWQLVEHIRIAQWDMLQFSKDGAHQSPEWPDGYWPEEIAPANDEDWNNSLKQIEHDLDEFVSLLTKTDIYAEIPHGNGQTILREALQIADHTAYHTAEIIVIRRLLGVWD